jgi:hypothetical protein
MDFSCGDDRPDRVFFMGADRTEDSHDGIAGEFLNKAICSKPWFCSRQQQRKYVNEFILRSIK